MMESRLNAIGIHVRLHRSNTVIMRVIAVCNVQSGIGVVKQLYVCIPMYRCRCSAGMVMGVRMDTEYCDMYRNDDLSPACVALFPLSLSCSGGSCGGGVS